MVLNVTGTNIGQKAWLLLNHSIPVNAAGHCFIGLIGRKAQSCGLMRPEGIAPIGKAVDMNHTISVQNAVEHQGHLANRGPGKILCINQRSRSGLRLSKPGNMLK